jgi:hypothetical protein
MEVESAQGFGSYLIALSIPGPGSGSIIFQPPQAPGVGQISPALSIANRVADPCNFSRNSENIF